LKILVETNELLEKNSASFFSKNSQHACDRRPKTKTLEQSDPNKQPAAPMEKTTFLVGNA
jgi:hypothetical protein